MARTLVGVNDPKAVKKYSGNLALDVARDSFFGGRMMSAGKTARTPIQKLTDLENENGDRITFDLSLQLRGQPIEGDDRAEDDAEDMKFATDIVYIDQMRKPVSAGGKMTRKRTMHNLRERARELLTDWFARAFDELIFMYGSGARGVNDDWIWRLNYSGFAGNPLQAPDALHTSYPGAVTAKNGLAASDTMSRAYLDKVKTKSSLIGGGTKGIPSIQPVRVGGADKFVVVMRPESHHALRNESGTQSWFEITKALATAVGKESPLYTGALGEYNGMILQEHKAAVRFSDYGASANINASRALFLGRQAVLVAFGNAGAKLPFDWVEKAVDLDNELIVAGAAMVGVKKATFEIPSTGQTYDFGAIAMDHAIDVTLGQ